MIMKRWLVFCLILAVAASLVAIPIRAARADTGPKPTMNFRFVYDISPALTILSGDLLECSDPACADAAPLRELGPQSFHCSSADCSSMAYGYAKYHRLSITFSDGQRRESNVFGKKHFQARYAVQVLENSLQVRETGGTSQVGSYGFAAVLYLLQQYLNPGLLVTILVELAVGGIYVLWRKRPWLRVLLTILLMNLLTQPVVWLVAKSMRLSMCRGNLCAGAGGDPAGSVAPLPCFAEIGEIQRGIPVEPGHEPGKFWDRAAAAGLGMLKVESQRSKVGRCNRIDGRGKRLHFNIVCREN